ncbi:hypothetical protein pEaSNUABM14_00106 [Erwinia phage pEa_SNUABM_14]|uniref:Uncharacterized protein n=1 Tax=Erwinia phage pEa_SNUABM_7 TaxID=2866695 RepID=A0AAE7WTA5_9CAUD|nr:hypothetical protein MPK74_gp107 [Erwinia phage pEa_SNUABM_7]QYW03066.1 hypothetical protein pEaSNUABM13_00107 [Erwinia phage pEa_SNUABM_13]QYW03407.1 hypothetical protein pEaSNUABM34_00105 [Erwinia phage pEa_SNUABM_34]QYW03749.1 hypothetical protein pEaSNUABM45_00106 [Erwinia phage pEa_SNUABM_45]QYW04090.1 hypothetical protein pEaSNUABM46_00106 [Erwinia phage pEa_SNUABM_46]QYW04431.1 hypothetical protein pEaSNUABM14_00106 [Erwinia phage pEa_SNUABM_14]QYW05120.1 hypothetical protein pEaSNU
MNAGKIKIVILVGIALAFVSLIVTAVRSVNPDPESRILKEDVSCLSAICVVDGRYGQSCLEFKPKMAHTYKTTDVNEPGAQRVIIELNDRACKG